MLMYIRNVMKREEGATAVEYGLMVAAIAAVIVVVVFALGKLQIVIGQFTVLLLQLAFDLVPRTFEFEFSHNTY